MEPFIIIDVNNDIHEYVTYNDTESTLLSTIYDKHTNDKPGWYYFTPLEMHNYEKFFSNKS